MFQLLSVFVYFHFYLSLVFFVLFFEKSWLVIDILNRNTISFRFALINRMILWLHRVIHV